MIRHNFVPAMPHLLLQDRTIPSVDACHLPHLFKMCCGHEPLHSQELASSQPAFRVMIGATYFPPSSTAMTSPSFSDINLSYLLPYLPPQCRLLIHPHRLSSISIRHASHSPCRQTQSTSFTQAAQTFRKSQLNTHHTSTTTPTITPASFKIATLFPLCAIRPSRPAEPLIEVPMEEKTSDCCWYGLIS